MATETADKPVFKLIPITPQDPDAGVGFKNTDGQKPLHTCELSVVLNFNAAVETRPDSIQYSRDIDKIRAVEDALTEAIKNSNNPVLQGLNFWFSYQGVK